MAVMPANDNGDDPALDALRIMRDAAIVLRGLGCTPARALEMLRNVRARSTRYARRPPQ